MNLIRDLERAWILSSVKQVKEVGWCRFMTVPRTAKGTQGTWYCARRGVFCEETSLERIQSGLTVETGLLPRAMGLGSL